MADYFTPTVVEPPLPLADITPLEASFSALCQTRETENGLHCHAWDSVNDFRRFRSPPCATRGLRRTARHPGFIISSPNNWPRPPPMRRPSISTSASTATRLSYRTSCAARKRSRMSASSRPSPVRKCRRRVRRHGDADHRQRDHQRIHERPPRKMARRRLPVTLRLHDIACLSLNSPRSPRGLFAFWRLPMTWTDDRVQTLTHRWQNGYSASLIGAELGFPATPSSARCNGLRLRAARPSFPGGRRARRAPRFQPQPGRSARHRRQAGRSRKSRPKPRRPLEPPPLGPAPPIPVTVLTLTAAPPATGRRRSQTARLPLLRPRQAS